MVVIHLQGGLGNQLFQIAAARALAQRLGQEVRVDLSWFEGDNRQSAADQRRDYLLPQLGFAPAAATPAQIRKLLPATSGLGRWLRRRPSGLVLRNPDNQPCPEFFATPAPAVYLDGYWQGEVFFQAIRAELAAQLAACPIAASDESWVSALRRPGCIALHVRRGDYVSHAPARDLMCALPVEYYASGVRALVGESASPHLVIFSDDIPWCRQHLGALGPPTLFVERADPRSAAIADFLCLSQASTLVIANSTFSWWAAWLATQRGARVVTPNRWFNPPAYAAWNEMLVVPGWIRR